MQGLIFTFLVWSVVLAVAVRRDRRGHLFGEELNLGRERFAVVLLLMGTHTFASPSGAEEVLSNPLVLERAVRGSLAGLALVLVMPALLHGLRQPSHKAPRSGLLALSLYVVVGGLSVIYSVAPVVSAAKVFEVGTGLAIVWVLVLSPDHEREIKSMIRFIVILEGALVTAAVIGFFLLPGIFANFQFRPGFFLLRTMGAPYDSSNVLGASAALVAAFALASHFEVPDRKARRQWMVLFLIASAAIVLASARQGVLIWVASVSVVLWVHRRTLVLLLAPPIGIALVANWNTVWAIFTRDAPYTASTLTGRFVWWQAAMDAWAVHPWTGYGFGVGGRFVALANIGRDTFTSVHSGYLEAMIGVGIVGLIPLALAVMRAARWSLRNLWRKQSTRYAILLVPLLLHNIVDLGFTAWLKSDFLLFAAIVALADFGLGKRRRRVAVGRSVRTDSSS